MPAQREEAAHQRAADVVRQVADQAAAFRDERAEVDRERVGADDLDVRGRVRGEGVREPRVDLDRDHAGRAPRERQRERSPARADLEEHLVRGRRDRAQQLLDRRLAKEVLPEPPRHAAA